MSIMPEQPQSIGRVLDSGIKLYRRAFTRVVPITLLGAIAMAAPGFFFSTPTDLENLPGVSTFFIYWLLAMLVWVWIFAAIITQLHYTATGRQAGLGEVLGDGLGKLFPALGATIVVMIVLIIGFLLLIIPGLILMVSTALTLFAVIVENQGPVNAVNRSRDLVRDNWWRAAAVLTVAGVALFVVFFALLAVVGIALGVGATGAELAGGGDVPTVMMLVLTGLQVVLEALLYPILYAISYALYHDLKLRKSGADLSTRISAAAAAS